MNILQWLKNKSGKLPITLAQAAGITAVVGAASFGAMTFLSSPSDNNNAFLPPSATQDQVVYVAQSAGGGFYEANGEVGSSFKAAPSRAIQLANRVADQQAQTRALEESARQAPSLGGGDVPAGPQMPQAYQLTGADLGQGLGGGKNKDLNASLDTFSTIQNQLAGVTQAINNAQAGAGQANAPAQAAGGQNAAQLASAPRNWGSGGLTRSGGGGSANSFAVQNSGKNKRGGSQEAQAMAQAGDAIAQAQAAMAQLQEGGPRMRSQANFGPSEGLTKDKDARTAAARRFGQGKDELDFIRKKSAAIARNKTNAANEAGSPFLASTKISGGLTVNGEQVTTGQSSSGDLGNNFDKQMKGIGAKLAQVQANMDERKAARDDLKRWFWIALTAGLATMVAISLLSRATLFGKIAAAIMAAAAAAAIWVSAAKKIGDYKDVCGTDKWTALGWFLASILTAGFAAAYFLGPKVVKFVKNLFSSGSQTTVGADALATPAETGASSGGAFDVAKGGSDATGNFMG